MSESTSMRGLALLTSPAVEPVSLEVAKAHLRLETDADDAIVSALISAARDYVERYTRRALIRQRWRLTLDRFPANGIPLPLPPIAEVEAITYRDTASVSRDVAPADFSLVSEFIFPAPGLVWPETQESPGAVTVDYWAGWPDADAVPATIKQAILLLVGHWYENREATIIGVGVSAADTPFAVEALLASHRSLRF